MPPAAQPSSEPSAPSTGHTASSGHTGGLGRWRTPRVVATTATLLALTAPGQTAGLSLLVDPLVRELDVDRAVVSTGYMLGSLAGALAMPFVGAAIDRHGPRRVLAVIAVVFGGVLLAAATVQESIGLTASCIGLRMAGQGALPLAATTAVAFYVERHRRGMAQGLTSAFGISAVSLAPVLLESSVADHGFRTVWLVEGLTIWAIAVPLAVLGLPRRSLVRSRTRSRSRTRARTGVRARLRALACHRSRRWRTREPRPTAPGDWKPRQVLGTGFFWVVSASIAAVAMLGTGVSFHQISLLGERGLSPTAAAASVLPQTVAELVAALVIGVLADRLPPRLILITCMGALALALAVGGSVGPRWAAIGFGAAIGVAGNGLRVLEATAFPRTYGLSHIGAIRGFVHSSAVAASAIGPVVFALGHDVAGSYRPVLLLCTVLPTAVALAAALTPTPRPARLWTGGRAGGRRNAR